ncbi:MAG: hypothetical protein J6A08_07530 [Lachnospiraceae bacterium]|nr:hypothetical protein [Lachnospiraceae bacterium]
MRFACVCGKEHDNVNLQKEYKAAPAYGEVRLGASCLFYRYFIKIRYVDYGEIVRAYLREESGESGEFLLKEYYLMLEMKDGGLHKLRMERDANAKSVLACLEKEHEEISIGFYRPSQSV